jgi:hypothetical protein
MMEMERASLSVGDILELYKNGMLKANPEYQRGIVWTSSQRKKLIDSVMRNYPLPLIYLHHIEKYVAGMRREDLEIIDGQQRINALHQFAEGGYKLFHPIEDEDEARFPRFLKDSPCPWGGKDFHSLSDELQKHFLETPISVAKIKCDNDNEARDLFVRLQAGLPLNFQETRDAWPGQFTDFILRIGGKPQLARYPGHPFFQRAMGMNPATDRGKTRQLAAQIAMLFFGRREKGPDVFSDINSPSIDNFYYTHIDFDASHEDAKRLIALFDKLDSLLGTGHHPKIRAHDAIHLVLLVDTLWDEYTRSWETTLPQALDKFSLSLAKAKASKDSASPDEFWLRYGQWTRVNSDRGDRIRHRHQFYVEKMLQFLQPLQLKDPKRLFGPLERELVYLRDDKKCATCKAPVLWSEAEVHHVQQHTEGGQTVVDNGVLVHKHCHPKGATVVTFQRGQDNSKPIKQSWSPSSQTSKNSFLCQGKVFSAHSAGEAMRDIFRSLAERDATFLDRFAAHKQGKKRNYIAQDQADLYPGRPDLRKRSLEIIPGWWIGTNYSKGDMEKIIRHAEEVAGSAVG